MENFATMIMLLSFIGLIIGLIGPSKGRLNMIGLRPRKKVGLFLLTMFFLFIAGGCHLPDGTDPVTSDEQKGEHVEPKAVESFSDGEKETSPDDGDLQEDPTTREGAKDDGNDTQYSSTTHSTGELSVHFVDVGQGAAQVIVTPNKRVIVIDGGNNDDEDDMVAYLRQLGIDRVDLLIGTHPDADHIGGIDSVIDAFPIGNIYMPKVGRDTETFESVLLAMKNKGLKAKTAKAGITFHLDPALKVEMIAPIGTDTDANEMSAVLRMEYGDHSFLFTGDAGHVTERKLIDSDTTLTSTVLLVGHHGSAHSTGESFLEHVRPKYAVIQVGKNNYGHPAEDVLRRLDAIGTKIYRNDTDGTIVFTTDGKIMKVNTKASSYNGKTSVDKSKEATGGKEDLTNPHPGTTGPIHLSAKIDNPFPTQNERVTVTVTVKDRNNDTVGGANVSLTLHYKSKDTVYEGMTDQNGIARLDFSIGRAAIGFTVEGEITASFNGETARTTTAFTPK